MGIVFHNTESINEVINFYTGKVGMNQWLEQEDCTILDYSGFKLGFCDRTPSQTEGTVTFLFPIETALIQPITDYATMLMRLHIIPNVTVFITFLQTIQKADG